MWNFRQVLLFLNLKFLRHIIAYFKLIINLNLKKIEDDIISLVTLTETTHTKEEQKKSIMKHFFCYFC